MTVHWNYEGGRSEDFDDTAEAEQWLTSNWRDLLDGGVESVELVEDGEVLYEMALTPQ